MAEVSDQSAMLLLPSTKPHADEILLQGQKVHIRKLGITREGDDRKSSKACETESMKPKLTG